MSRTPAGEYADQDIARIQGGIQGFAPVAQEHEQRLEQEKPLSPLEQWVTEQIANGMSPREAAVAVKAGYGPGGPKNQDGGSPPQASISGMTPPTNLGGGSPSSPSPMGMGGPASEEGPPEPARHVPVDIPQGFDQYQPGGPQQGGGMTAPQQPQARAPQRQQAPRPQNRRDMHSTLEAGKVWGGMQRSDTVGAARVRADGQRDVAGIRGEYGELREGHRDERADKDRKERARQFDGHIGFKENELRGKLAAIRKNAEARHRAGEQSKKDKTQQELLKGDEKMLQEINKDIVRLQNELHEAKMGVGGVDPKLQDRSEKMISELQAQAGDLGREIHRTKQSLGGRQGMEAPPGSPSTGSFDRGLPSGAQGPEYQPQGRAAPQGGPPPLPSGPDVRAPRTITLRDRKTGKTAVVPAEVAENALRDVGEEAFMQMYEIAGSADEETHDEVRIPPEE